VIDKSSAGSGVLPYLPLPALKPLPAPPSGSNAPPASTPTASPQTSSTIGGTR
jgi:hypothetical protein